MSDELTIAAAPMQEFGLSLAKLMSADISDERLRIILDIQERAVREQARAMHQAAFARFTAKMPQVGKDGVIKHKDGSKIYFAEMSGIDEVARPLLTEQGLSMNFVCSMTPDGQVKVTGKLSGFGHEEISELTGPPDMGPGRDRLQAIGSAVSKLSRYIAIGLLNIVRSDGVINGKRPPPEHLYEPRYDPETGEIENDEN